MLDALFTHWKNLVVDLQVFSNCIEDPRASFMVEAGKAEELFRYLREIPYDGATDLAALDFSVSQVRETEAWFLFSDGLATLNDVLPKMGGIKIFTITSQAQNNLALLQYLADQTGAKCVNLHRTQPQKACEEIIFHNGIVSVVEGQGCEDLVRREHGGRQIVMGRLVADVGILKEASSGHIIQIFSEKAVKGDVLARQWAGQQIQFLSLTQGAQSKMLLSLAQRYCVVSPGTSLLVLENIEQYLEYGIEPPASRPEMLNEYRKRNGETKQKSDDIRLKHLENVVRLWQQRVVWWQKEFKPEVKKGVAKKNESMMYSDDQRVMRSRERSFNLSDDQVCYSLSFCRRSADHESLESNVDEEADDFIHKSAEAVTTLKAWSPDTPYLVKLKECTQDELYCEYLKQRKNYALSPGFFFDCSAFFFSVNQRHSALRVLSNLMEMNLEDVSLMRMYGWRLQQAGELDQAISVFEKILALRDDEPQSYRDLALALSDRWEATRKEEDVLRAMELLYDVVLKEWERFPEIEIIALMELNRLIHLAGIVGIAVPVHFDSRLIKLLDLDIRISMSWDADLTDIDLHVFEPTGEHANYAHQLTMIGGLVSRDFREGYGPEEYVLHKAVPGTYQIKAHYFSSHQQALCGPCMVTVNVFTNYGRPDEKRQVLTLRLEESGHDFLVGEVVIQGKNHEGSVEGTSLLTKVMNLQKGMSVSQITEELGQPHQVRADRDDKVIVFTYTLPDQTGLQIALGPELVWAKRIVTGAEVDIVS